MAVDEERRDGAQNEEEEEVEAVDYKAQKDAVLFAIDVSETMLTEFSNDKKDGKVSATLAALKCAYQLMQQRIISNPNDMMGVLLFGTKDSKGLEDESIGHTATAAYPHCYLVSDLDIPAAVDVKRLRDLANDPEEAEKTLVASDEQVHMSDVLFCANQIFTTKAPNFTSRRLFLVTDNDNPHRQDKDMQDRAAVRARDLYDLGVTIELFPIAHDGIDFDRTVFYDNIIYRGPSDPDAPAPVAKAAKAVKTDDGISLLQSLISSVNSKSAPCRALFSIPLDIAPGLRIGVKGFMDIKRQEVVKSCYIWVGGEKAQIVTGAGGFMLEDTARSVEKKEMRRAYDFGGEQIAFTEEERESFRDFGENCLRIIGFKPLSMLPVWANFRPAIFVYPDEDDFIGSTRTFSALQQTLLKQGKFAMTWVKTRSNARPMLGAMIAGEEKLNKEGDQIRPPGLWLIPLPFADDLRKPPDFPQCRAPDELVDRMKTIMDLLRLPQSEYDPSRYPNPSLQYFYKVLQALALEEEVPEKAEDKTVPRYKQIYKRTNQQVADWKEELEIAWTAFENDRPTTLVSRPLKREHAGDGPAAKRAKAEPQSLSDAEIRDHADSQTLEKLTVAVLKEWAAKKRVNTYNVKKAELVANIEMWLDKNKR